MLEPSSAFRTLAGSETASASAGYGWLGSMGQPSACKWQASLSVWLMPSREVKVTLKSVQSDPAYKGVTDFALPLVEKPSAVNIFLGKSLPIFAQSAHHFCLNALSLGLTR